MKKHGEPVAGARTGLRKATKAGRPGGKAKAPAGARGVGGGGKAGAVRPPPAKPKRKRINPPKGRVVTQGGKKGAQLAAAGDASLRLEDAQQERFCLLMADGRYSQTSCYAQAYPDTTRESARANSSRLMTYDNVRRRVEWLRAESLKNFTCSKEEVMRFLHQVVFTPVGYLDEESPLAQEVVREMIERGEDQPDILKVKIKTPGKKECAELLAKMQGWEKPKELIVNMAYEPPGKALERAQSKGLDVAGILAKAGLLGGAGGDG